MKWNGHSHAMAITCARTASLCLWCHLMKTCRMAVKKVALKSLEQCYNYLKKATASYVTWTQAVDNLKFYINELRAMFFTQLQLPDWSYEKMSQQALSGESRKQLFIDAQMKV